MVPVFIATPTSACASAGASYRHHASTRLLGPNQLQFVLRCRFGHEVVNTRFMGNRCRRQRIVAGDHDSLDAHRAQVSESFPDAALDDILQLDDTERAAVFCYDQRGATLA
jgi:hypothetical protein